MRRDDGASTSVGRHLGVMCPQGSLQTYTVKSCCFFFFDYAFVFLYLPVWNGDVIGIDDTIRQI